jgi:thiamine pyrophosphokinase
VAASAVIAIGGEPYSESVVALLPAARFTIAADSGLDHARRAGLHVDLVVGDLDSASPAALAAAARDGVAVERHPRDKDAVDTELAIDAALARGFEHLVVLSGGGDRLDHGLAALFLLAAPRLARCRVEAWWAGAHIDVLRGPAKVDLAGRAGAIVSLIPVHGDATGVTTAGLRFPLDGEDLPVGTSRGVSNEFLGGPASVSLRAGALLVIVPDGLGVLEGLGRLGDTDVSERAETGQRATDPSTLGRLRDADVSERAETQPPGGAR